VSSLPASSANQDPADAVSPGAAEGAPATPTSSPAVPVRPLPSLRSRREFAAVLRDGRRTRRGRLAVAARANGLAVPRVGYAVGRRVGGAVVRNRVRRRLRELMRLEVRAGMALAGWDVVVTALDGASATPFQRLGADLHEALVALLAPPGGGARAMQRPPKHSGEGPSAAGRPARRSRIAANPGETPPGSAGRPPRASGSSRRREGNP
jgi:ribonuclease P protein component